MNNVLPGDRMTLKKTRSLISVFLVAVILNYLWELAQAPLYVGLERYDPAVFWHCFVASLGDRYGAVDRCSRPDFFSPLGLVSASPELLVIS